MEQNLVRTTISKLSAQLDPHRFVRVHRSGPAEDPDDRDAASDGQER